MLSSFDLLINKLCNTDEIVRREGGDDLGNSGRVGARSFGRAATSITALNCQIKKLVECTTQGSLIITVVILDKVQIWRAGSGEEGTISRGGNLWRLLYTLTDAIASSTTDFLW
jgi:hypothetical protein